MVHLSYSIIILMHLKFWSKPLNGDHVAIECTVYSFILLDDTVREI